MLRYLIAIVVAQSLPIISPVQSKGGASPSFVGSKGTCLDLSGGTGKAWVCSTDAGVLTLSSGGASGGCTLSTIQGDVASMPCALYADGGLYIPDVPGYGPNGAPIGQQGPGTYLNRDLYMENSAPQISWFNTAVPSPTNACDGGYNFYENTSGLLEINSVCPDGTLPETFCQFAFFDAGAPQFSCIGTVGLGSETLGATVDGGNCNLSVVNGGVINSANCSLIVPTTQVQGTGLMIPPENQIIGGAYGRVTGLYAVDDVVIMSENAFYDPNLGGVRVDDTSQPGMYLEMWASAGGGPEYLFKTLTAGSGSRPVTTQTSIDGSGNIATRGLMTPSNGTAPAIDVTYVNKAAVTASQYAIEVGCDAGSSGLMSYPLHFSSGVPVCTCTDIDSTLTTCGLNAAPTNTNVTLKGGTSDVMCFNCVGLQ